MILDVTLRMRHYRIELPHARYDECTLDDLRAQIHAAVNVPPSRQALFLEHSVFPLTTMHGDMPLRACGLRRLGGGKYTGLRLEVMTDGLPESQRNHLTSIDTYLEAHPSLTAYRQELIGAILEKNPTAIAGELNTPGSVVELGGGPASPNTISRQILTSPLSPGKGGVAAGGNTTFDESGQAPIATQRRQLDEVMDHLMMLNQELEKQSAPTTDGKPGKKRPPPRRPLPSPKAAPTKPKLAKDATPTQDGPGGRFTTGAAAMETNETVAVSQSPIENQPQLSAAQLGGSPPSSPKQQKELHPPKGSPKRGASSKTSPKPPSRAGTTPSHPPHSPSPRVPSPTSPKSKSPSAARKPAPKRGA